MAKNRKPGRPPLAPENKVDHHQRFLTTGRISQLIQDEVVNERLTMSDVLRLALYQYLVSKHGAGYPMDMESLRYDPTFENLRLRNKL